MVIRIEEITFQTHPEKIIIIIIAIEHYRIREKTSFQKERERRNVDVLAGSGWTARV